MRMITRFGALLSLAGVFGCDSGSGTATEFTFYEDVAPILMDNCVTCHRSGGIAPFELLTYGDVVAVAPAIGLAVSTRDMPPWGADNSGDCQTWADARWLSDAEITTISDWVASDRLPGDIANAPVAPQPDPGLSNPTAVIDMGAAYQPSALVTDDYRCFVVDYAVPTDKFLTAFEMRPGEPRVVHHMVLYAPESDQAALDAEQLDANDPGLGYSCFGGANVSAAVLAVWAPGVRVNRYPAGTGLPVAANRKLIMQVHYNLEAGPLPDRSQVAFELVDSVPKPAFLALVANFNLSLAPGQALIESSGTFDVPLGINVSVWGQYPHMHTLGRTLRVDLESGDTSTCMVNVPRWEFEWQQLYSYASTPIQVRGGDVIRITCGYDTSAETKTVTWGEGTRDEMCLSFLYTTPN